MSKDLREYRMFELLTDVNPAIKTGMVGVILIVYSESDFEAEFVKEDGTNYEHEGSSTFTLNISQIQFLPDTPEIK